jgi:hypothetical protein
MRPSCITRQHSQACYQVLLQGKCFLAYIYRTCFEEMRPSFITHQYSQASVIKYFFRKNAFLINFRYRALWKYILFLSYDRVSRKCGLLSSLINILKPVIKYFFRKNAFKIILVTLFEGNKAFFYLINISSLLASISSGKMLFWLILIDRILWKSGHLSSLVNILKPVIKYFFRESVFLANIYRTCFEEMRPSFITSQHYQACYQVPYRGK